MTSLLRFVIILCPWRQRRKRQIRVRGGRSSTGTGRCMEVLDGSPVSEVAVRYGVSRQSVYTWRDRYAAGGIDGLREASRRPRTSPSRLPAEVEALVCELRRAHPRWGARRIAFEVAQRGAAGRRRGRRCTGCWSATAWWSPQAQRHKRKYKRWQRETPMALWQLDLVGGIYLADGRECKMLSGIDDHSRFVVCAAVLAVPSGRAVADAFTAAMRTYGVPSEVLTDNGKQFTGRFTKPRPAEVLFERVCREHGITAKLTGPYSPTTTGKVERWHRTLRRELLDAAGPFADLPSAQAAITAWVHAYNHARPHQALDMATPASLFRPGVSPDREPAAAAPRQQAEPAAAGPVPRAGRCRRRRGGRVRDGDLARRRARVLPGVQRIKMGPALAGQARPRLGRRGHRPRDSSAASWSRPCRPAWTPRTWPSCGCAARPRPGRRPRCPRPARAAPCPRGTVIEVDRTVDVNGIADLAGQQVKIGAGAGPRQGHAPARRAPHPRHPRRRPGQDPAHRPSRPPTARRLRGARIAARRAARPGSRARSASSARSPATASSWSPASGSASAPPTPGRSSPSTSRTPTSASPATAPSSPCTPAPSSAPSPGGKPRSTPRNPSAVQHLLRLSTMW